MPEVRLYPGKIQELFNSPTGPVAKILLRKAIKVTRLAKEYCPVDTGRLMQSIAFGLGRDGRGIYAKVGTNVKYARAVEFGHRQEPGRYVPAIGKRLVEEYTPARSFLRQALEVVNNR